MLSFWPVLQKKIIDKEIAYIDPRYRTRSYAEGKLVEIMEKCWAYEADDRIDIFEAVRLLREAAAENRRLEAEAAANEVNESNYNGNKD